MTISDQRATLRIMIDAIGKEPDDNARQVVVPDDIQPEKP